MIGPAAIASPATAGRRSRRGALLAGVGVTSLLSSRSPQPQRPPRVDPGGRWRRGGGGGGGGGTAKPPAGAIAPFVTATLPDPVTSVAPALIHGFEDVGFIQSATVDATNVNCPHTTDPHRFGGTLRLNQGPIVVPCNTVIQLPANTMTWADFVNGGPDLTVGHGYPSFEMRAVGNIVGNRRIAGLLFASQQAANAATGVITAIDYGTGNLAVDTGDPAQSGDRANQRPERPLRPAAEPGREVQRRRRQPHRACRHRLPDVRAAQQPRRQGRSALPPGQPSQPRAGDRQRQERGRPSPADAATSVSRASRRRRAASSLRPPPGRPIAASS